MKRRETMGDGTTMTTTTKTTTTKTKTTCWNCAGDAEGEHELVVEISAIGVGRQQRNVPLCNRCASLYGKE
jgi:hypothetical protein